VADTVVKFFSQRVRFFSFVMQFWCSALLLSQTVLRYLIKFLKTSFDYTLISFHGFFSAENSFTPFIPKRLLLIKTDHTWCECLLKYMSMASWVWFSASGSSLEAAASCFQGESSEMWAGNRLACWSTDQNRSYKSNQIQLKINQVNRRKKSEMCIEAQLNEFPFL